jgi:hypothetical protein
MRRDNLILEIGACLALSLAMLAATCHVAWAQGPPEGEGWKEAGKGLWTRTLDDGTVETEAVGRAGLIGALDRLNAEMVNLVDAYLRAPTEDMAGVLDTHLALIKRVEQGILAAEDGPPRSLALRSDCTTSYSAAAGALSGCGNYASGSTSYSGTSASACFGLCDLYSYAYVSRTTCDDTLYTASQSCSKSAVINQSCSSYASLSHNPVKSCYAYGYSSIYCPAISWFRSASQTSVACGSGGACQGCGGCTVTASCANAGGGSVSCTGSCGDSWALDDCYAYCDGTYNWCPSVPWECPI